MDFMVKKYGRFARFVYIHLYTFVTNQSWFNCDLKTHHPWRALSCWPSTWGDSCILTTLRVLTRRGLDSTFSGRLAAACQQGLITFHDIMAFRIKHSTKSRRSEGLAFLNCFLGLRHGPDGPFMAQSKKAIATETWQRLRNDIRLYLSSAKINHKISWNVHQQESNGLRMFGRHLHQPTALITVQLKTKQSYAAMPQNLS